MKATEKLGLYIHVPFCVRKCGYCDFYSLEGEQNYRRYVDALLLHMEDYSPHLRRYEVDTVYIGGGTPTVLPPKLIADIMRSAGSCFNLSRDAEVTVECNPGTASRAALAKYRRAGINRLSMGVQSASESELRALSRIHTFADAQDCFEDARRAGFDNISVDLMFGIPGQTKKSLRSTLERVCDLGPEHVSLYGLKIEEGTPFARKRETLKLPEEDEEAEMYFEAIDLLAEYGYAQYEISNFAQEGRACRHNIRYWRCDEYLGLGPGAHSYLGNCRFSFKRDAEAYMTAMEKPDQSRGIVGEKYTVRPNERIDEYVMLRLRTCYGIDTADFAERFGKNFDTLYGGRLEKYIASGHAVKEGGRRYLTPQGMYISNYILSDILQSE